ncbi:MAG TPA: MerR family transcriptional regulator [Prosthecobacter sp.]
MKIRIPPSALDELELVDSSEWSVSADELVEWVNQTAERFLPDAGNENGRVKQAFTLRSIRHYQTLGCIDAPEREGREARYGFRHYLQALLVRKLLWERLPAERIVTLLAGKTEEEYKQLLLDGIEILAVPVDRSATVQTTNNLPQSWQRLVLADGLEVHFCPALLQLEKSGIPGLLSAFEKALRLHGGTS